MRAARVVIEVARAVAITERTARDTRISAAAIKGAA
jgi:hypothetical protein